MRHPGTIAATLIDALYGDAASVEPKCDGAAPPRGNPINDRHHRSAPKPCAHLTDDRIEPAASERQSRFAGDDRDRAAARRVDARGFGAVEPVLWSAPRFRPLGERLARLLGEE